MIIPIPSAIVKVASFVVNLICSFIVPCVANVAYKLRIGESCDCPSPSSSPPHHVHRARQHKKLKAQNDQNNDIKRIKLLLDITVGQNGSKVLDIQASTRGQDRITEEVQCKKNPGIILRLLNSPSSIMLYFVDKIRLIAHDLEAMNNPCQSCNDDRVKKSPKRRMTRSNYRKIIPFFPFNLLGFSNYSAFQMPSITNSCTSTTEDYLNASNVSTGNGKTRCKRRRNSSSDESSEISDEEISFLEYPEKSNKGSSYYSANGGVDEVDSDETAETVTKRMTSSSSSNEPNHRQVKTRSSNVNGNRIQVALNTSTSEDNAGNATAFNILDNSDVGGVGEEQHVRFSFIQELNEAANESYNSMEDPDYEPSQSCSSTTDSFATDKGNSDENSFLVEHVAASTTNEDDVKSDSVEPASVEPPKAEDVKTNGTPATPANPETVPSNGTPKTEEVATNGSSSKLESVPSNGSPQTEGEATPTNGTPKAEATPTNGSAKKDNFPSKFNSGKGKSKKGNNAFGYQQK